jgi:membrane fusion protein (multidrug efflux system)
VRAPVGGIVSDVRIHPGGSSCPARSSCSLVGEGARFSVIAMLPGHHRPLLQPGVPLRSSSPATATPTRTWSSTTSATRSWRPNEVRRFLGAEIADTVSVARPGGAGEGALTGRTFRVEDKSTTTSTACTGIAEARVRSESVSSPSSRR